MLEVCFSDSVKGALRIAQHSGMSVSGPVSVALIGAEDMPEKEREKEIARATERARAEMEWLRERAVPLGGSWEDVVAPSFALSLGDIQEPLSENCARRELLFRWMTAEPWDEPAVLEKLAQKYWESCMADFGVLTERARTEPVRIWADQSPDSLCGLLFAAELLCGMETEVSVVFAPGWLERHDGIVPCMGWGDMHPEEFGRFACEAKLLPVQTLRLLADRWCGLREENASLRTVVNGEVVSVGENFYDDFLRREMTEEEMTVGWLIGNTLGKGSNSLKISDFILAERIRLMLSRGELRMVREDAKRFYGSIVRKNNG